MIQAFDLITNPNYPIFWMFWIMLGLTILIKAWNPIMRYRYRQEGIKCTQKLSDNELREQFQIMEDVHQEMLTKYPNHKRDTFELDLRKEYFKRFIDANSWTKNYFPEQRISVVDDRIETIKLQRVIEKIFHSKFGDVIEKWLMNVTDKRWKKKTKRNKLNNHGERISMIVGPHFSKPNPDIFQLKIINEYELRVNQLLSSYELIEIEQ